MKNRKKMFMKDVKREAYKELKIYLGEISILYRAFNNKKPIIENEDVIFEYIKNMPVSEVVNMFFDLLDRCDRLKLRECFYKKTTLKLLVIQYIQEMRKNEGLI
jgi:hypothetical protein